MTDFGFASRQYFGIITKYCVINIFQEEISKLYYKQNQFNETRNYI